MRFSIVILSIFISAYFVEKEVPYNIKGKIKRIVTYSSLMKDELSSVLVYSYDQQGLADTVFNYYNSETNLFSYSTYEYEAGLLKAEKFFLFQAGAFNHKHTDNYFYVNNVLSKKEHYVVSKKQVLVSESFIYRDKFLMIEKKEQFDPYFVLSEIQHIYDSKGIEIETKFLNENNEITSVVKHHYLNGLLIYDYVYDATGAFQDAIIFTYDPNSQLLEKNLVKGTKKYLLQKNKYNVWGASEVVNYSFDSNGYSLDNLTLYEYY